MKHYIKLNYKKLRIKFGIVSIMLLALNQIFAQTKFITAGKIEYEKKTNMHAMMGDGFWSDQLKDNMPQFHNSYFDLTFANNQSVYLNGKEVDDKYKDSWFAQTNENVVYNNYDSAKTISTKQVFEKNFLLQDSLVNIEWRMTNETRNIAGFECRKAVGRFMDTLYVVAFYTEEILSTGGPDIFSGLPGMILGIGFPRMHYTLYATKVEVQDVKTAVIKPPTKGKKTNRKEMFVAIKDATKDWGKDADKYFLRSAL